MNKEAVYHPLGFPWEKGRLQSARETEAFFGELGLRPDPPADGDLLSGKCALAGGGKGDGEESRPEMGFVSTSVGLGGQPVLCFFLFFFSQS